MTLESDTQVMDDTAGTDEIEDRAYDNLEDAVAALADDDDEVQAEPEQAEAPAEDEAEPAEETAEAEPEADLLYELPDGETLTLAEINELRASEFRQQDYTRKTTALADERTALEETRVAVTEKQQFVDNALNGIGEFLNSLIPPEPPLSLAQTNSQQYLQQKALREQAMREMGTFLDMKSGVTGKAQEFSAADMEKHRTAEDGRLVKAMPHLSDPVKRAAFDKALVQAGEAFGFSADDIAKTPDARIRQALYYAGVGKRAETNRQNAARRVETPRQGRARPANVSAAQESNRKAMQRLSKSGSLEDAMKIDF